MKLDFNGKTIDIYNPTAVEAEHICDCLVQEYIKTHCVLDLDKVQGYDSIITKVVYDISCHNIWIAAVMISYLRKKYEVTLAEF